jgi:hypothetical protein
MYDAEYQRRYNRTEKRKESTRRYHLRSTYGLSLEEREAMGNTCALCGKSHKRMAVDHDHKTGEIRGILCLRCNGALGVLGDSVESLQRAIDYLQRSSFASSGVDSINQGDQPLVK